jgi:hypothetical protein
VISCLALAEVRRPVKLLEELRALQRDLAKLGDAISPPLLAEVNRLHSLD